VAVPNEKAVTLIGERVDASGAYRDGASRAATQCAVTVINQRRELAPPSRLIFRNGPRAFSGGREDGDRRETRGGKKDLIITRARGKTIPIPPAPPERSHSLRRALCESREYFPGTVTGRGEEEAPRRSPGLSR